MAEERTQSLEEALAEALANAPEGDDSALVLRVADEAALQILEEVEREADRELVALQAERVGFEARLRDPWGPAIDRLEVLRLSAMQAAEAFDSRHRPVAAEENDVLFEALSRLAGRAFLVTSEVLTLLRAGHATGANARWRTLHEIAVVAFFLLEHGGDVAERYLLHDRIASWQGLKVHKRHAERLGETPLSLEEANQIVSIRDQLVAKYGAGYANDWGWAAEALRTARPSFAAIEQKVEMSHWRPYVRMASYGVHADPKSVYFDLGLDSADRDDGDEVRLAGPSNMGLADPGQSAAISLGQAVTAFLLCRADLDSLAAAKAINSLANLAQDAFMTAHDEWERRIEAERAEERNAVEDERSP